MKYYTTYIVRIIIGIIIGGVAFYSCSLVPRYNNLLTLIIEIIVCATVVIAGLLIVSFKTQEFDYLRGYLLRGIRRELVSSK